MKSLRQLVKDVLPRQALQDLARLRREHVHAVVRQRGGEGAFCIVGERDLMDHCARVYLGSRAGHRVAFGWHGKAWDDVALAHARRHGLVLAQGVALSPALRQLALRVPRMVAFSLDLDAAEDAFLRQLPGSARSDVRLVQREGYGVEMDQDPHWAPEFYHRHHLCAMASRHGSEGSVMAVPDIERAVREMGWEFLCITLGGRRVAAALAEPHAGGYRMRKLGWLDADPGLLRRGVVPALYWFCMRRARELGIRRVQMGGVPPYVEDGLFRFKMKWNSFLDATEQMFGEYFLLIDPAHPRVRALLAQRSLIALDGEGRFVVYSARRPQDAHITEQVRNTLAHWYTLAEAPRAAGDFATGLRESGSFVEQPL